MQKFDTMKYLFLLIALLICVSCYAQKNPPAEKISPHHPNRIDSLKTEKDAVAFFQSIGEKYRSFNLVDSSYTGEVFASKNKFKYWIDSLYCKSWDKADFDNNGLTDLIIYGHLKEEPDYIHCILDMGSGKYKVINIQNNTSTFYCPLVKSINGLTVVFFYHDFDDGSFINLPRNPKFIKLDTLALSFGEFIEYHKLIKNHTIDKIEMQFYPCLGTCPEFNIAFFKNRTVKYKGISFNKINGTRRVKTTRAFYDSLASILNYIDFTNLKDTFSVPLTDLPGYTLKITYDDGKVKSIYNYGYNGTFGMGAFEDKIFDFKARKNW